MEQEEKRRRERRGGGRTGKGGEVTCLAASLPFGSRSCVLPSPALIYCPRVATEMRRSMYFRVHTFLSPLRATGSALVAGEALPAWLPTVASAVAPGRP